MDDELLENGINKDEILENISEIFFRYGIKSSSMDDIARYLKMSKKTLYNTFENKADVVDQVVLHRKSTKDTYFSQLDMAVIEPIPYIWQINEAMKRFTMQAAVPNNIFDLKKYYPEVYRKHFQEINPKYIQIIHGFFEKGIADGVFRKEINQDLQAYLFSAQLLLLSDPETTCNYSQKFEMKDLVAAIIENFIRSIATPKGIIQLEKLIKETE
jgi:AcrR family transcriptional regulator